MNSEIKDLLEAGAAMAAILTCVAGGLVFVVRYFRARARARKASGEAQQDKFSYPEMGEVGRNLLHPGCRKVTQGEHVAVSAVVPENQELMVCFTGEPSPSMRDVAEAPVGMLSMGDWFYSVAPAPLNWRGQRFEQGTSSVGPSQTFKAVGGKAELDMHFERVGAVELAVFECGSHSPSWTKTFHVVPRE